MSASRWLPLVLLLAGCGSPPPGAVDVESEAIDLAACLRNAPTCVKSGDVGPTKAFFTGDRELSLTGRPGAPSSITLPLERVDGGTKLRWLALGIYAQDVAVAGRLFTVTVDGHDPIHVEPSWGFSRIEIDMQSLQPAAGARVTITAEKGQLVLIYASGRWDA